MTHRLSVILSFAVIKGTLVAAVTAALDIEFWKSLIIACVSGGIGALGAIVAAYIAVRETRETRSQVKDAIEAHLPSQDDNTSNT